MLLKLLGLLLRRCWRRRELEEEAREQLRRTDKHGQGALCRRGQRWWRRGGGVERRGEGERRDRSC